MSSRDLLTSEGESKVPNTAPRDSLEIFDDLTLKVSQISSAVGIACRMLPEAHVDVVCMLRLLQQSLEDVKDIADELFDRVPS
jgi:hypothetical protein